MKANKVRHAFVKGEDMKKNFRFITVGFFILVLFTTLLNLQSYAILPTWLKISTILILIVYAGLFGYGFFLINKFQPENWMKNARFIFLVVMLFSVQLLLISNAIYIVEVKEDRIREQVNYLQFTLLIYSSAAVIFFILSLFVTAPKLRKVNSMKAYVIGTVTAMVIITLIFLVLFMVRNAVFTDARTDLGSYDFFIGSVLALFPATVLGTGLMQISLEGSRK
ncbi:hypothetical protein A8F94_08410 [Bacillus sp. FJAT-27225]|uniref:hypothetical protein n=1 Tax=Bacillus sp. FJAT-27225 TaxID=1743144 RepID=UPI00080C26FB|nr:hypothetical protein [Bacillus sp. FJAT-27225]OCA87852.1 hypothetical protein A8F94_08410 [Bacillus sp. FJAT-27225]